MEFAPFLSCKFQWEYPAKYRLFYTQSIVQDYPGTYINLDIPKDRAGNTRQYTITMGLKCTNGRLPERLRLGDICEYAAGSPQFATFKNIKPVTAGCRPSIHNNALWHVLSHRKMHHICLTKETLCSLLKFYTFPDTREIPASFADHRRIDGIKEIKTGRAKAFLDGALTFGREVEMRLSRAHYRSLGDMYLFGCVLDYFVSGYATDLSFTRFKFIEEESGREYKWPLREGLRRSI